MSDCYYDDAGCLVCPEQAAQPFVPSRIEQRAVLGWNAGANSIDTVDGGLHVVFDMPPGVIGTVIGLKGGRKQQTVPALIEHGWYFQKRGSVDLAQPMERGVPVGPLLTGRSGSTLFEIRRTGEQVRYLMGGVVRHTSAAPSIGAKVVNCCLYASSDAAPGGASSGGGDGDGGGDTLLVSGVPVTYDFEAAGTDFTTDPGWYIDVPTGATNVTFEVAPPDGNAADVAMAVNFGTRPTGGYPGSDDPADYTAWDCFTYSGAATSGAPNAPPVDLLYSVDDPSPGRYYVILNATAAAPGYVLTATVIVP